MILYGNTNIPEGNETLYKIAENVSSRKAWSFSIFELMPLNMLHSVVPFFRCFNRNEKAKYNI